MKNPHIKMIKKEVSKFSKLLKIADINKKELVEKIYKRFFIVNSLVVLPTKTDILLGLAHTFNCESRSQIDYLTITDILNSIHEARLSKLAIWVNKRLTGEKSNGN